MDGSADDEAVRLPTSRYTAEVQQLSSPMEDANPRTFQSSLRQNVDEHG